MSISGKSVLASFTLDRKRPLFVRMLRHLGITESCEITGQEIRHCDRTNDHNLPILLRGDTCDRLQYTASLRLETAVALFMVEYHKRQYRHNYGDDHDDDNDTYLGTLGCKQPHEGPLSTRGY